MYAATHPLPDPRFVRRLHALVQRSGSPRAFAMAGSALASALLVHRGRAAMPAWVDDLARAMGDALMLVQARTVQEDDAGFRIELATAAAVLSVVRPELGVACEGAVRVWMGLGLSDVAYMTHPDLLTARTLLALLVDDGVQAEQCLVQLGEAPCSGVLHDWVVARRQAHGAARELDCFLHLRLALADVEPASQPDLELLAAAVAWARTGVPRGRLLLWLDELGAGGLRPLREAS